MPRWQAWDTGLRPGSDGMVAERNMKFTAFIKKFSGAEDGAVTVDWVVLTAAVCGLVVVAMAGLQGNMTSIGQQVQNYLSSRTIE